MSLPEDHRTEINLPVVSLLTLLRIDLPEVTLPEDRDPPVGTQIVPTGGFVIIVFRLVHIENPRICKHNKLNDLSYQKDFRGSPGVPTGGFSPRNKSSGSVTTGGLILR